MLFDIIKLIFKLIKSMINRVTGRAAKAQGNAANNQDLPAIEPMPPVYPRIKHVAFIEGLKQISDMPASSLPVVESLVGDLVLSYAMDMGDSYVSVSPDVLTKHMRNQEELRPMAEDNALDAMRQIRQFSGIVNSLETGDNLIAASILYPELWEQLKSEMGGDILVAFPHRDKVLYVREDDEPGVVELRRILEEEIDFKDAHALSKRVYKPINRGWKVLD